MGLKKCPKCELNYIREGETMCNVCLRTMKSRRHSGKENAGEVIICSECGEKPAEPGQELCADCLREQRRQEDLENVVLVEEESYEEEEAELL